MPTSGASVRSSGTACRCMFDPMSAVGVVVLEERDQAGATETSWFGDTSMQSTCSGRTMVNSPPMRDETRSFVKLLASIGAFACAMVCSSSSSAER